MLYDDYDLGFYYDLFLMLGCCMFLCGIGGIVVLIVIMGVVNVMICVVDVFEIVGFYFVDGSNIKVG